MPTLRGRKKLNLIHEIAQDETKPRELASRYGLTQAELRAFKRDNAYEVALVRVDHENEFAGLWITKKRDRLAETQDVVERAQTQLAAWDELVEQLQDALRDPDNAPPSFVHAAMALRGGRGDVRSPAPELMKVVLKALRQAAEEMGDLKQDMNLNVTGVRHEIVGIENKDLT